MHKTTLKRSPVVSLINGYDMKNRKCGFAKLCKENLMQVTDVVEIGLVSF